MTAPHFTCSILTTAYLPPVSYFFAIARLSIARALAVRPEMLIMDEAFKGMDEELKNRVLRVTEVSLEDTALLLITHSGQEALSLGCTPLRYHNGRFS